MFSKEQIADLKSKIDIVDLIGRFIELKKRGKSYWGLCPFHNDSSASFSVTHRGGGIWKCFSNPDCGSGDVIGFYIKYRKTNFSTAIMELAELYDFPLELSEEVKREYELKKKIYDINSDVIRFYSNGLKYNHKIKQYLDKRNISQDTINTFNIGSDDMVINHLTEELTKKYSQQELLDAGILDTTEDGRVYEVFRNRVVIPLYDENNLPVGFSARTIIDGINPKYRNTRSNIIFDKQALLYGLNLSKESIRETKTVIITEGYFDVIRANSLGIKNTVAICGVELYPQQIDKLNKLGVRNFFLALDSDKAGTAAIDKTYSTIKESNMFANIRVVNWR